MAFAKAQDGAGQKIPLSGNIFISVADRDKASIIPIAKRLFQLGFKLISTKGTAEVLTENGIEVEEVRKVHEGRPNIIDLIKNGQIDLVINTPMGSETRSDGYYIRTSAVLHGIPCITTIAGCLAAVQGIEAMRKGVVNVASLQEYHAKLEGEGLGKKHRATH